MVPKWTTPYAKFTTCRELRYKLILGTFKYFLKINNILWFSKNILKFFLFFFIKWIFYIKWIFHKCIFSFILFSKLKKICIYMTIFADFQKNILKIFPFFCFFLHFCACASFFPFIFFWQAESIFYDTYTMNYLSWRNLPIYA